MIISFIVEINACSVAEEKLMSYVWHAKIMSAEFQAPIGRILYGVLRRYLLHTLYRRKHIKREPLPVPL
jgi:hypothetical protein